MEQLKYTSFCQIRVLSIILYIPDCLHTDGDSAAPFLQIQNLQSRVYSYILSMDAYPFAEAQGSYARVQTEDDGGWAIINCRDEIVLGGFDSINDLHYLSLVGSGIKDGKAVLFSLEDFDGRQPGIIKEFADYTGIVEPYEGSDIAIVTEKGGKKGVLCIWNGELVVPAVYEDIQWGFVDTEENEDESRRVRWFCCLREDGTYDVKYWKF